MSAPLIWEGLLDDRLLKEDQTRRERVTVNQLKTRVSSI